MAEIRQLIQDPYYNRIVLVSDPRYLHYNLEEVVS